MFSATVPVRSLFAQAAVVAVVAALCVPSAAADDVRCIDALNKNARKVTLAWNKALVRCVREADRAAAATADQCATIDAGGRAARAAARTVDQDVGGSSDVCAGTPPPALYRGAAAANATARVAAQRLARDLFGTELDASIVVAGDHGGAACRTKLYGRATKTFDKQWKVSRACLRNALRGGAADSSAVVAACFAPGATGFADPKGKMDKARAKLAATATSVCHAAALPVATLFPGTCAHAPGDPEFGACVGARLDCRLCRLLADTNALDVDCDLVDDGSANGSCAMFATYLAGTGNGSLAYSAVRDVAVDATGNVYATGGISLGGYGTVGAATETYQGGTADAFVAKFSPSGALEFFTYLGGPNHDRAYAIEVDAGGVTIGGRAGDGFPTTSGAFQTAFAGGGGGVYGTQDGFVARLSLDGSSWQWVTYLGDAGGEFLRDIDVDPGGNVWAALLEVEGPIPLLDAAPGGFQSGYGGGARDAALVKLSSDGASLLYGTYVGGSAAEVGAASVRTTSDGGVYYVVSTESDDAPATAGAFATTRSGRSDVLLLRLDAAGALVWGSYYGGFGDEGGETHNLAVAADDTAIVGMFTNSTDLPGAGVAPDSENGFLVRFSADGSTLAGARYVGGGAFDEIEGVAATADRVVATGGTRSPAFPTSSHSDLPATGQGLDGFVAVYSLDLSRELYGARISGAHDDWIGGVAFGPAGELAAGGYTRSSDVPVSGGAIESAPHAALPVDPTGQVASGYDAGVVVRLPPP